MDKWKGTETAQGHLTSWEVRKGLARRGSRINWAKEEWPVYKSSMRDARGSSKRASVDGIQHWGFGLQSGVGVRPLASESQRPGPTKPCDLGDKFQLLWVSVTSFREMWWRWKRVTYENSCISRCPDSLLNYLFLLLFIECLSVSYYDGGKDSTSMCKALGKCFFHGSCLYKQFASSCITKFMSPCGV